MQDQQVHLVAPATGLGGVLAPHQVNLVPGGCIGEEVHHAVPLTSTLGELDRELQLGLVGLWTTGKDHDQRAGIARPLRHPRRGHRVLIQHGGPGPQGCYLGQGRVDPEVAMAVGIEVAFQGAVEPEGLPLVLDTVGPGSPMDGGEVVEGGEAQGAVALSRSVTPEMAAHVLEDGGGHVVHECCRDMVGGPPRGLEVGPGGLLETIAGESEVFGHVLPAQRVPVFLAGPVTPTARRGVSLERPTDVEHGEVEPLEAASGAGVGGVEAEHKGGHGLPSRHLPGGRLVLAPDIPGHSGCTHTSNRVPRCASRTRLLASRIGQ